jgi:hypothetical protein
MHCYPGYHKPFCSCPRPELAARFNAERRVIEHNAPFIRLAAAKRVAIKRAARIVHIQYVEGCNGNV